ncbi:MAG: elongation factor 1-beta [Thermoprotei archaeon]|nr:MAG: elongation factor 1-beta [Thermoprotei archaeon]
MGGKVYLIIKVYPSEVGIDLKELLEDIKKVLPKGVSVIKSEEEPVAFGLKLLKVHLVMPEETEGGTAEIEKAISGLDKVSQVEVAWLSRMVS